MSRRFVWRDDLFDITVTLDVPEEIFEQIKSASPSSREEDLKRTAKKLVVHTLNDVETEET